MTLKTFRVVAEKSHGIVGSGGRHVNPFHIRNIFDPNLTVRVERRTWDAIQATSERAARRLFDEACKSSADMRGFKLVSLVEVNPNACPEGGEHECDEDGVCLGCGRRVR
jgi:hypothetical protein